MMTKKVKREEDGEFIISGDMSRNDVGVVFDILKKNMQDHSADCSGFLREDTTQILIRYMMNSDFPSRVVTSSNFQKID